MWFSRSQISFIWFIQWCCTSCRGSCVVVTCAERASDLLSKTGIAADQNFHRISITMRCVPGSYNTADASQSALLPAGLAIRNYFPSIHTHEQALIQTIQWSVKLYPLVRILFPCCQALCTILVVLLLLLLKLKLWGAGICSLKVYFHSGMSLKILASPKCITMKQIIVINMMEFLHATPFTDYANKEKWDIT